MDETEFLEGLEKSEFEFSTRDLVEVSGEEKRELDLDREQDREFVCQSGYLHLYRELEEDFQEKLVVELLKALNREKRFLNPEEGRQVLQKSEDPDHLRMLTEEYLEKGEMPETEKTDDLHELIEAVLEENNEARQDLENGKPSVKNFVIGKVMEKTHGKADAEKLEEILRNEYMGA